MGLASIFMNLKERAVAPIDFNGVKRLAERHAAKKHHLAYERSLTRYDPGIEFVFGTDQEFVGAGKGQFTLNSYRRLKIEGRWAFEKIYASGSLDWQKCLFFYENLLPGLAGLRVPGLLGLSAGQKLTVARFEYVDFQPVGDDVYLSEVLYIAKRLGQLPSGAGFPQAFADLSQHFGFERCFRKTIEVCEASGRDSAWLIALRARCEVMPRFVGHGDLSRPNMGGDGLVLDWDNLGFYPPGFDLALALVLLGKELTEPVIKVFAQQLHPALAHRCRFEELWFSLIFFYGVFLSARKADQKMRYLELLDAISFPHATE